MCQGGATVMNILKKKDSIKGLNVLIIVFFFKEDVFVFLDRINLIGSEVGERGTGLERTIRQASNLSLLKFAQIWAAYEANCSDKFLKNELNWCDVLINADLLA